MKARKIWILGLLFILLLGSAGAFLRKKTASHSQAPICHPFATKVLKEDLLRLFRGLEIQTCVDIPCGEASWIYEITPLIQNYTGVDTEEKRLQKNREKYGSQTLHFQHLDISKEPVPKADLIFCHDALNFLTQNEILASLLLFKKSGAKYLLVSTHPDQEKNRKGKKGIYHSINWQLPPYQFPKPLLILNDPNEKQKKLALWRMEDL
ncbi:MAG TPA: class I SAM-dependent methyltransferase [Rhabdochlamydiaceae bacterium]|nr:class I SAM-dependent methyltransferase [Rhabdochlamydiaceae bacterium]